jgi:lipopolysaccharide transport system permease protein
MKNSYLLRRLIIRDFRQKYKGSVLGILWSVIVPLFMMAMYTFVFSEIFQARWSENSTNKYEYALVIFCGLSAFNMLSEVMTRSVGAITGNVNYVKKVIFPLYLIPFTITVTAFVNCLISYGVLLIANVMLNKMFYVGSIQLIIILVPLFVTSLGLSYALSATAVYYRDIANAISILVTLIMYISPVFYSLDVVPTQFRFVSYINPLAYVIENARRVCLYGQNMNLDYFIKSLLISVVVLIVGYFIFDRTKDGFADVM